MSSSNPEPSQESELPNGSDATSNANRSNRRQVFQAAGVVAVAFILSRIIGLVRDAVVVGFFGVDSVEATAYALANRFPDLIFNVVVGGALGSAFIPTFSAYFTRDDEAGGWRLFSAIINLVLIVTTVLAAITALAAVPIVRELFISEENLVAQPDLLPLTVRMMRIMLISPIIFGVSGVFMGALNARQHFLTPALAATIYNVGIILGVVLFAPNPIGLAWGTVIGAAGHLLIQLPALRQKRASYTAGLLGLREEGVRRVLILMAPRVLGLSFSYLNRFVLPILARPLIDGSLVALDLGLRIMTMPYSFLGQSIGVAAFPTLSTLAAEEKWDEMRHILATSLRSILFLGLPMTAGLMVLGQPAVQLLFERGQFDAQATQFVSWALFFYALAMVALATIEVVARTFYALSDTVTPVVAGMLQLPLMMGLSAWLAYTVFPALDLLPLGGVALGFSISNILEVILLLYLLQRKLGGLGGRHLLDGLWRMGAASIVMVVVLVILRLWLPFERPIIDLAVGGIIGGGVYAATGYLFKISELDQLLRLVMRRLGR